MWDNTDWELEEANDFSNGKDGEDVVEACFEALKRWRIKKKRAMIKQINKESEV